MLLAAFLARSATRGSSRAMPLRVSLLAVEPAGDADAGFARAVYAYRAPQILRAINARFNPVEVLAEGLKSCLNVRSRPRRSRYSTSMMGGYAKRRCDPLPVAARIGLSSSAAIPNGRCRPSAFGIQTLRDGCARYAPR